MPPSDDPGPARPGGPRRGRQAKHFVGGEPHHPPVAISPGTFDPVTHGHFDIMRRALGLFDHVVVALAVNVNKRPMFPLAARVKMIRDVVGDDPRGEVDSFHGLLVDYARARGARFLIRGLRAVADFEERRIDVSWESSAAIVTARCRITSKKSQDLFSEIENAVHKFGGRLREGRLGERGDGSLAGSFIMEFESREDVRRAVKAMRGMPSIISVDEDE